LTEERQRHLGLPRGILGVQEWRMATVASRASGVRLTTIRRWAAGLDVLHARIARRFRRAEVRARAWHTRRLSSGRGRACGVGILRRRRAQGG